MGVTLPKLSWCIVRLGNDYNWWVKEISDSIHWDLNCLSILDPKQVSYIIELTEDLKDYGFMPDHLDRAFFRFKIDRRLEDDMVRLVRTEQSLLDTSEPLFALPDVIDEEKGPYVDFLDYITRLRVKFLNDTIGFEKNLSNEDITEELTEKYRLEYFEGNSVHVYRELTDILEFVPDGFEIDKDGKREEAKPDEDTYKDLMTESDEGDSDITLELKEEEEDTALSWEDDE